LGSNTNLARGQSASAIAFNVTDFSDGVFERQALIPAANQQRPCGPEMKMISQPPGRTLDELSSYGYNQETEPVLVYVIDSGADMTSTVRFPKVYVTILLIRIVLSIAKKCRQDSGLDMAWQRKWAEPPAGVQFQLR
jgi:hypothetical protein